MKDAQVDYKKQVNIVNDTESVARETQTREGMRRDPKADGETERLRKRQLLRLNETEMEINM